jgi:hypothetical protein
MKWALFLAWPVALVLVYGTIRFHTDDGRYIAGMVTGAAALVAMCVLGVFTCPRCGARMYVRTVSRDTSPDGCRSCGIDVGTPKFPPEG